MKTYGFLFLCFPSIFLFIFGFLILSNVNVSSIVIFEKQKNEVGCTDGNDLVFSTSTYARPSTNISGSITNPNIMYNFFNNAKKNIGFNIANSCTFVALDMILDYYDFYLNDNIIPDTYDIHHNVNYQISYNGTFNSNVEVLETQTYTEKNALIDYGIENFNDYLSFISDYADEYFHLYLLRESMNENNMYVNPEEGSFAITMQDFSDFSRSCIQNLNINGNVNYYYTTNTSNYLSYIKSKIDNGIPVIINIGASNNNIAHAVVAYHYSGNIIYFNDGYGNYTHCTIEQLGYEYYLGEIVTIEVEEEHICNDDVLIDGDFDCICELDGTHLGHTHSYSFLYITIGTNHYISCTCGMMKTSYHTINQNAIYVVLSKEYAYCIYCNEYLLLSQLPDYFLVFK